ncbi:MAG TPA: SH3 domain-containing protein [Aggregatilinea sp.]|uniref:SH3 domain-containing protein n=1 Tax=Aggregatilinea sp. TaxID=2806333 RepID=UPI002CF18C75|nr:SH3 domain-containing protein [Aggregatilinea sp.]HML22119.1 SH3 domain-containing protein [Aggregatilinea sp.]
MHVRKLNPILAALLVIVLGVGLFGERRAASAQSGPLPGLMAVIEGQGGVFVRTGPSNFYPVVGYLTAGSLIAIDGRSSRGSDAWVRTWRNHQEVWVPAWRVTVLGAPDDLPVMFRLVTPPYAIRMQAENMGGDGTLRLRRQAIDDLTVRMVTGQSRSKRLYAGGIYRVEVYFLNRGYGTQTVEVSIDGTVVSRAIVRMGTAPGYNTIVGYDSAPFIIVPFGTHLVQVRVTGNSRAAIELDEVTLRPVLQRFSTVQPVG